MKPKAPKKKDIKPSAKSGEVREIEPCPNNWYIGNDGRIWFRHKWVRINNSDKDK